MRKRCRSCGVEKPLSEFYSAGRRVPTTPFAAVRGDCKECNRASARSRLTGNRPVGARKYELRRYGITPEQYASMLSNQGGVCAICRQACSTGKSLQVDHCHTTGKVRGLLCNSCNTGLGHFKDNPDLLIAAANYLGRMPPFASPPQCSRSRSRRRPLAPMQVREALERSAE